MTDRENEVRLAPLPELELRLPEVGLPELQKFLNLLFFPVNRNWTWYPIRLTNRTIEPGKRLKLIDVDFSGWIYWLTIWTDSPDATIVFDLHSDTSNEYEIKISDLKEMGALNIGQGFFNLLRYDDTNDEYVVAFLPITLGIPFRGGNRCYLENPTTGSITLKVFRAWLIQLW